MTADQAAREQALDAGRSFIVEAPAGSGKTGLLTQRFLRLLSVVERPESIVAMTFTRKAAAEMKQRIHEALTDAAVGTLVSGEHDEKTRLLALAALARDQEKGWNLLADTSQLQVQTIDSLCAMLTRQMPVVSEFGGVGRIVEDPRELYRLAARSTLRELTEGDAASQDLFHQVALHFDNDMGRLELQIASMLQKRDQWDFLTRSGQQSLVAGLCELLDRARHALRVVFRETATVDFTEVARAARKALGTPESPTDLLYSLDYRIEHLLVDEFQDTSRGQYALVKALTEQWSDGDGRTLFVVGDPMQSIYRFREAEVALFLHCWATQQLGAVRLHPLSLTVNFRSTPELVEWVQQKIGPVMARDDARLGAVKFRNAEASRNRSGISPTLVALIEDDGTSEAAEIVRIIKAGGKGKDIAILARSRMHLMHVLPALRSAGIAYRAIEIDALAEQQHVMDLIALTRAILHAGDRVSWLACLRAPWCGLTLADLSALAENEPKRTILDLLSDSQMVTALSPEGRSRAVRAQEILTAAVESVGRLPLRELVENAWFALGGPAVLREPNQYEDSVTYFDLLEKVEEGGVIRDFSLLSQRLELFYARPATGEECVEVMTIHQAKGLEFDTVLIPQTGRGARSSERDLLIWTQESTDDGNAYLSIAAQPQRGEKDAEFERIHNEVNQKEAEELKRLFYVACTRAKNELYLFGSVKRKKSDNTPTKPGHNTFLGLIWDSAKEQFASEIRRRVPVQRSFVLASEGEPATKLLRLPANWEIPRVGASVRWQPELQRVTASERKVTYEWVSGTSRHVGTVVHEMLKRAAQGSTDHVGYTAIAKAELLRLGVPTSEEEQATKQAVRAVTNTLNSPRGSWVLRAHAEARSEWPIAGRIGHKLITGTIDRLFRDEQGRLWIIDFKNSEHRGGGRETFLDEEQRRYSPQIENYGTLMKRIAKGPIWLGLYFPLLDAWREWQLAEETATAQ